MYAEVQKHIPTAINEIKHLFPETFSVDLEIEEVEERTDNGNFVVTFGYWVKDNKPLSGIPISRQNPTTNDFLNPWRKKFKRIEIDPKLDKVIAIRMYEPPLGVS